MTVPDNNLALICNGISWSGWTRIRVTAGAERVPRDFTVEVSERFPKDAGQVDVRPNDACQIMLGNDLVINGFIDSYEATVSPESHTTRVSGRGRCADLVDCSAGVASVSPLGGGDVSPVLTGGQITSTSALGAAQFLASPFGIQVTSTAGNGAAIPFLSMNMAESPFSLIERIARYSGLLVLETPSGDLQLAQVGTVAAASGFQEGINIQSASVAFTMAERFSVYLATWMSTSFLSEWGDGNRIATLSDSTVNRFRPRVIISEQIQDGESFALQRARWELARRVGRSQQVVLVTDGWRDGAGQIYRPNTLATVSLPSLKLEPKEPWLISEVTFSRDAEAGTTAIITLMPPAAFSPQPELLYPTEARYFLETHPSGSADSFNPRFREGAGP